MSKSAFPIVILLSGYGSNLQAIIDTTHKDNNHIIIKAVISNTPDAYGLQRAKKANIPTKVLPTNHYANREDYDRALIEIIDHYQPKLIVLAGFMRILSSLFVQHYLGKIINIHPSLLPKYKGLNTHKKVLAANDQIHGCTVHFVTEELDGGNIIAQMQCPVVSDDTIETLQAKVHQLEHQLYPNVIQRIACGEISL